MHELILALLMAVSQVESGDNDRAVGDGGRSHGRLQIQLCVIEDVNRIYGTNYQPDCRYNTAAAKDIFTKYLQYYGRYYEHRTGRKATLDVLARIWNGGPNGWRKTSTEKYWRQVRPLVEENSRPSRQYSFSG